MQQLFCPMLNSSAPANEGDLTTGASRSPGRPSEIPRILISDDQHEVVAALSLLLKINRFETATAYSPQDALQSAQARPFDLLLLDLNYSRDTTSGQEGLELLSSLRAHGVTAPIVVMTAWGNVELAVEAMRLGANDFVQKPWDNSRLIATIKSQLNQAESRRRQGLQHRSELEIARHVQEKLFPQSPRIPSGVEYGASCVPAQDVGGDYYDIFDLGPQSMAGLLADVSGKGVGAAMLMANLQACFRTQIEGGRTEAKNLLETVNRLFHATTPAAHYATLFYFEYDNRDRRLQYVNCGHVPPALLRSSGKVQRLDANATVLGLFGENMCESESVYLNSGDVLAIFTDGFTEFPAQDGEEFGEERFVDLVESVKRMNPESAVQYVIEQVKERSACAEQMDDQTLLILKVK